MWISSFLFKGNPVYVVKELEDVTVIENADVTFTVALSRDVGRTGKWYHKVLLIIIYMMYTMKSESKVSM